MIVEIAKTRIPRKPEIKKVTIIKMLNVIVERRVYFIFATFCEKNLAKKIVIKKEIMPEIKIITKIRMKIFVSNCPIISETATAAPVLPFEIT